MRRGVCIFTVFAQTLTAASALAQTQAPSEDAPLPSEASPAPIEPRTDTEGPRTDAPERSTPDPELPERRGHPRRRAGERVEHGRRTRSGRAAGRLCRGDAVRLRPLSRELLRTRQPWTGAPANG